MPETLAYERNNQNHVFINCESGFLHGCLSKIPDSAGLVIFAGDTHGLSASERQLSEAMLLAGLSVFEVSLLTRMERYYQDVHHNVPFLAKRLGLFIDSVKAQMDEGCLAFQPYGIFASNHASPVAVRAVAACAPDVEAMVCCDGLIDLAGVKFLHALTAPLLMIVHDSGNHCVAAARRALQELACPHELKCFPSLEAAEAVVENTETAKEAVSWFLQCFEKKQS